MDRVGEKTSSNANVNETNHGLNDTNQMQKPPEHVQTTHGDQKSIGPTLDDKAGLRNNDLYVSSILIDEEVEYDKRRTKMNKWFNKVAIILCVIIFLALLIYFIVWFTSAVRSSDSTINPLPVEEDTDICTDNGYSNFTYESAIKYQPIPDKDATCLTPSCLQSISAIKQDLNVTVQPCDDFLKFTCNDKSRGRKSKPGDDNIAKILLEGIALKPKQQYRMFYEQCLKSNFYTVKGGKQFMSEVNGYVNVKNTNIISDLINLTNKYGSNGIVTISLFRRGRTVNAAIVPDYWSFFAPDNQLKKLGKFGTFKEAKALLKDLMDRRKLDLVPLELPQHEEWKKFAEMTLPEDTKKNKIKYLIDDNLVSFMDIYVTAVPNLAQNFLNDYIPCAIVNRYWSVQSEQRIKEQCQDVVKTVYSLPMLEQLQRRTDLNPVMNLTMAHSLVNNIKYNYIQTLRQNKWLAHNLSKVYIKKVDTLEFIIGFPKIADPSFADWLRPVYYKPSFDVEHNSYLDNMISSMLYLYKRSVSYDYIVSDGALFDPSYSNIDDYMLDSFMPSKVAVTLNTLYQYEYDPTKPYVMNIGTFGYFISQTIAQFFVYKQRKRDGYGCPVNVTFETEDKFTSMHNCFKKQIKEISPQIRPKPLFEVADDIERDELALNILMETYLSNSNSNTDKQFDTLPYKSEETIFIMLSQLFCSNKSKSVLSNVQYMNTLLKNNDYFIKAFQCTKGQMNAENNKCRVWMFA